MGPLQFRSVEELKQLRVLIDALIQNIDQPGTHDLPEGENRNPELYDLGQYQARVSLIAAKMWVGKMLEGLGNPFPKELADKATPESVPGSITP